MMPLYEYTDLKGRFVAEVIESERDVSETIEDLDLEAVVSGSPARRKKGTRIKRRTGTSSFRGLTSPGRRD
jgi:hypothetical protein